MSSIFGDKPIVGIIMGSESDMSTMEACMKQLDELDMYKQLLSAKLAASSTVLVADYHSG